MINVGSMIGNDVFIGLGYLTDKDVESWRMKGIPYLEKSIKANLSKISFINKTVRDYFEKYNQNPIRYVNI